MSPKAIEEYLKLEKKKFVLESKEPKLLILGTSDSGKSTLLKQLKILYGGGFPEQELKAGRTAIRKSIVDICKAVLSLRLAENLHIPDHFKSVIPAVTERNYGLSIEEDRIDLALQIALQMYSDPDIQKTFLTLQETMFPANNLYFMVNITRIMNDNYIPTNEGKLKFLA